MRRTSPGSLRQRRIRPTAPERLDPPRAAPWPDGHEPTPFQWAVMRAVSRLRAGDLATYGEIAEEIGHPGSAQAVANVLRSAPGLPWWRVLPADGRIYRTHATLQAPLLEAEGHWIDDHRRVHPPGHTRVVD